MSQRKIIALVLSLILMLSVMAPAASAYSGKDRIYTVATAHLDTIWQWEYVTTINSYLPKTTTQNGTGSSRGNFLIFEDSSSPNYKFSFEGAWRYMLWDEYYPETAARIKQYISSGKWVVGGSGIENGDANVPSPESLIRNMLYGNNYFSDNFGKKSVDIYLPDCFGFGYALPSIARHSDLIGFGTQKLTWGYYNPLTDKLNDPPFDLGKWYGVDGEFVYAALNLGGYGSQFTSGGLGNDVRANSAILNKLNNNKNLYGLNWTIRLHGTGDTGGSPGQESATSVSNAVALNSTSNIEVLSVGSDQVYRDMDALLNSAQQNSLPTHNSELTLKDHGVGGYTSRAQGKRWNRQYELMGDVAERASSAAMWLGLDYNQEVISKAWIHGISQQFHDTIPGTSYEREYRRVWNDYAVSIFRFGQEYENAVSGVARAMNTNVTGVPVIVNNPVEVARNEAVEAAVTMPAGTTAVRVYNTAGEEVPSQIVSKDGNTFNIVFTAAVPSMGYTVYDVRATEEASALDTGLVVTESTMENAKYKVTLDENGDIISILDKANAGKELLASPIRMALNSYKGSSSWPAWELTYKEALAAPTHYAGDPTFEIVENGPARVTLKTTRTALGSTFEQYISLSNNGQTVEFNNIIDWHSAQRLLHTPFALTVSNSKTSYDLGLGVIERDNSTRNNYEFPAQRWADVTDTSGTYGVSVLSDAKYGWHKSDDNTLWLTGVHSPAQSGSYRDANNMQHLLEMGYNEYGFAVYGHANGYQNGTQQQADCFNQPLYAFQTTKHAGALGNNFSFGSVSTPQAVIRAVKKAEYSNEIIVRVNEIYGESVANVELSLGNGILSAREVSGAETSPDYAYNSTGDNDPISVVNGKLVFSLSKYQIRSFAIQLQDAPVQLSAYDAVSIDLPYNSDVYSYDSNRGDGALQDSNKYAFPAELTPDSVTTGGVDFTMGNKADGENNAVSTLGQSIEVPAGYNTLYLLANTISDDVMADFNVNGQKVSFPIHNFRERVGAGDLPNLSEVGYVKDVNVGMYYTHMHTATANATAVHTYMFKYAIDIPEGGATVQLPVNPEIYIYAATAVGETEKTSAVTALHDVREKEDFNGFQKVLVKDALPPYTEKTDYEWGFEDGEIAPILNEVPQGAYSSQTNVKVEVTDKEAHSGDYSLKFSGTKNGTGGSYAYHTIWNAGYEDEDAIYIDSEYYLFGFWMKRDPTVSNLNRYIGAELYLSPGTGNSGYIRDNTAIRDQNNYRIHSGQRPVATSGDWEYYEFLIGESYAGDYIYRIVISYDGSGAQGDWEAYYDDFFFGTKRRAGLAPEAPWPPVEAGSLPDPVFYELYAGAEDDEAITANFTPNTTTNSSNVRNVTLDISAEEAHSGSKSFKMTGEDTSTSGGVAYYDAFSNLNLGIEDENTVIGYWVKPMNELGRYVGLEVTFTDGTTMRSTSTFDQYGMRTTGATDQYGYGCHPSVGRGTVGEWNYVEFNVGNYHKGKSIAKIMICYDRSANTGIFTSYIDDINIFVREEALYLPNRALLNSLVGQVPAAYTITDWSDVTHGAMMDAVANVQAAYGDSDLTTEQYEEAFSTLQDTVWNLKERYIGFFDVEVVNQKINYTVGTDLIQVRVRATPEIQKIGLYNENGAKIGTPYQSIDFGTDDEGNEILVWDLWFTMGSIGQRTISVRGGVNSYEETDLSVSVKMIAKAAGTITLKSATGPQTAIAGQNFQVTVKTGKGVQKVGFYNEKDAAIGKTLVSCTETGEDELTWVYSMNIGTKGIRAVTVKVAGPDGAWVASTKTIAIIVNALPPTA